MARIQFSEQGTGKVNALMHNGFHKKTSFLCTVDDQGVVEVVRTGVADVKHVNQHMKQQGDTATAAITKVQTGSDSESHATVQSPHWHHYDADDEIIPKPTVSKFFQIQDTEQVCGYLTKCLMLLQQQVGKRIAKAWIKGICPKKQARFPYQNRQREEQEGKKPAVPGFWPIDDCEFREPDHISKEHRLNLCLHLLRLRPTAQTLEEWNAGGDVTDSVKALEIRGWTGFLKDLTPASIFDGLDTDRPQKRPGWERLLDDMYTVAQMEEEYHNRERDGTDEYHYTEPAVTERSRPRRRLTRKRSRQSSSARSNMRRSAERSHSAERTSKKARRGTETSQPSPDTQLVCQMSSAILEDPAHENAAGQWYYRRTGSEFHQADKTTVVNQQLHRPTVKRSYSDRKDTMIEPHPSAMPQYSAIDHHASRSAVNSPALTDLTSSFGSVRYEQDTNAAYGPSYTQQVPLTYFPGRQDYTFNHYAQPQNAITVNQAHDIPQPQFDTVPNTPNFSPMNTLPPTFTAHAGMMYAGQTYPDANSLQPSHQYQVNNQGLSHPAAPHGLPYTTAEYAMPSHYTTANPMQRYEQECYDCKPQYYRETAHPVGATSYNEVQRPHIDQQTYNYAEMRPENNFPAAALPGSVVRGFTGHGSGVGGHAMV